MSRIAWKCLLVLLCLPLGCGSRAALPASPPLGEARTLEAGVTEYEVALPSGNSVEHLWIYLPAHPAQAKLPCLFIAAAGTRLFHGIDLGDGDRPEHLPYARAGYAVVAYSLDGPLGERPSGRQVVEAAQAFKAADAGLVDAHAAMDYALAKVPGIDPKRLYAAGHSSAGTLSLLLAENDPRIAACIAYAPCCNVPQHLGPRVLTILDRAIPGEQDFLTRRSPDTGVVKLTCPLFLFHADDDSTIPAVDVAEFARLVRQTNPRVLFVHVPTGEHYDSMIKQGVPQAIRWLQALPARG